MAITCPQGTAVIYTRRHKRFQLGSQELSGQMTFASEVSILDIGLGGLALRADKRLNIGGRYLLKLEVNKKLLSVNCEVAWARMTGTKKAAKDVVPIYTAGMKFVGLSPENLSELRSFVEAIGDQREAREDERRKYPRFPARTPGMALLNFPADYSVRTISLSGMLIESAEPAERESRVPMVLSLQDGRRIDFLGRVVSCEPKDEAGPGRYHIGIEFIELTDAALEALAAFIAWLSTIDGEPNPA
jgi:Tfp pilus assembly protein PilZ